jgi:hypothetical protein
MARTAEQIQVDIDAVLAQAAIGDSMVHNADGSGVQSRSEGDRLRALSALRAELAAVNAAGSPTGPTRTVVFSPSTGYGSY